MRKLYKQLTKEQIERGVVFSSCLSTSNFEQSTDTIHEVLATDEDRNTVISRLLDDSFFNASPYNYNIVRGYK